MSEREEGHSSRWPDITNIDEPNRKKKESFSGVRYISVIRRKYQADQVETVTVTFNWKKKSLIRSLNSCLITRKRRDPMLLFTRLLVNGQPHSTYLNNKKVDGLKEKTMITGLKVLYCWVEQHYDLVEGWDDSMMKSCIFYFLMYLV